MAGGHLLLLRSSARDLLGGTAALAVLAARSVASSIANGSQGTVQGIKYDAHGKLVTIVVEMAGLSVCKESPGHSPPLAATRARVATTPRFL